MCYISLKVMFSFSQTDCCYYDLIEIFAVGFPLEYVMHS